MSLGVTKACFPTANECYNCKRKSRADVLEKSNERKDFQRCSGCHLMTYCDKDCQQEHWEKGHKVHCKLLSGRKTVQNSSHSQDTCALCAEHEVKKTSVSELENLKSPKTNCHIEEMIDTMRRALGNMFDFHGEGKTCSCSLEYGCKLPFPLGELSGQYLGKGIGEMVAHAIKIANVIKESGDNHVAFARLICQLMGSLMVSRTALWRMILVNGVPKDFSERIIQKHLLDPAKELNENYGSKNAWVKALKLTVNIIADMNHHLLSDSIDSSSIEDPKFSNLKRIQEYSRYQLRNQEYFSENKWVLSPVLWPTLADGSLAIRFPEGTRCQTCNSSLTGEVTIEEDITDGLNIADQEVAKTRPMLMPIIAQHGKLMACCSILKNPRCYMGCFTKDVRRHAQRNDGTWGKYKEEFKMFLTKGRNCDLCLKMSLSSHRCSECYAAQYCSNQCQHQDFKFHKTVCSSWAKDKSRKIISSKEQKKVSKSRVDECFKWEQQ